MSHDKLRDKAVTHNVSHSLSSRPAVPRVFISSTKEDLDVYRNAAKDAVIGAGMLPVMFEYFASGSGNNPPLTECLDRVSECDLLLVLVAHRYGWMPTEQPKPKQGEPRKSITWMECQQALGDGHEVIGFLIGQQGEWPPAWKENYRITEAFEKDVLTPELQADVKESVDGLKQFKSWINERRFRKEVATPDALRAEISAALIEWRKRHPEFDGTSHTPPQAASPEKYLGLLQDETANIEIRGLAVSSGKAHVFPIEDLYISLKSRGPVRGTDDRHKGGDEFATGEVPLQAALSCSRLVVIGDPGAGKSTFLRRVANTLCLTERGLDPQTAESRLGVSDKTFPILLRCAALANHIADKRGKDGAPSDPASPAWLAHCLETVWLERSTGLDRAYFQRLLDEGRCTILLDGLDEAPNRVQRDQLSQLAENLSRTFPKCRLVVTSRPPAYTGNTVLPQFEHVEIAALSQEAIETFLDHWSRALHSDAPTQADEHRRTLIEALQERPEIRRIARNPVMLTALAVVHWNDGHMPELRADLYESVTRWLSRSREQRPERPKPERTLLLLRALALAMQNHPQGRQVQVSKRWAAEQLAPHFASSQTAQRTAAADIAAAEQFLTAEELDSGIISQVGHHLRFWHLQFQEFLAASAIAGEPEAEQRTLLFEQTSKLYLPEWREVLLLFVGVLHKQGAAKVDGFVEQVLNDCVSRCEQQEVESAVSGKALAAGASTDRRKTKNPQLAPNGTYFTGSSFGRSLGRRFLKALDLGRRG